MNKQLFQQIQNTLKVIVYWGIQLEGKQQNHFLCWRLRARACTL